MHDYKNKKEVDLNQPTGSVDLTTLTEIQKIEILKLVEFYTSDRGFIRMRPLYEKLVSQFGWIMDGETLRGDDYQEKLRQEDCKGRYRRYSH